ncbi:isocitrate lyase/PEP mutase family protein [Jannaschia pohangensis]|uniref:2-Methylisocitrate lyase, PEP mutase family n=1 Tax=Jannaschia pohangensis TaxID=390807 RepID=A0A1I3MU00_9RHOB|nr:isocitrate lyase/phosphoenolpyruvate mutase family protein [Jannaschia pohangensis]SFJ00411.1 2-Methylisocitrate lyase, PEP mutase family [Jannaschia pohangensis]
MTKMTDRIARLHALHRRGDPLILCNVWDAGSATAVARVGARAIATSSWAVAAARGLPDGQAVTFDALIALTETLAAATDLPVSVDVEAGYGDTSDAVAANVMRVEGGGASGVNLEDQVIDGPGLIGIAAQLARIAAIRNRGVKLFLNARTDVVLKAAKDTVHADLLPEVIARGQAYAAAGADGFFVPGLTAPDLVARVCDAVALPVNVMVTELTADLSPLTGVGVARISRGPGPYLAAMATLEKMAS